MVVAGEVDASAVDSHVLAVALRQNPAWASQLRVIDSLGPSTIQPFVAACRLPAGVRSDLREAMLAIHQDHAAARILSDGLIERFVAVDDGSYNDIRMMCEAAESAGLVRLGRPDSACMAG